MPTTVESKPKTDQTVAPPGAEPARTTRMPSQRTLAIVLGVAAVIALGAWMVVSSARRKEEFGNRALLSARSAAEQGNLPLAATEFQKIIDTYRGTDAAQAAVIGLNQVRMINSQTDLAAVSLREFLASNPDPGFAAPAHGMLGAALENAGRPADAAAAYQRASEVATVDYLKAEYLINAGRALVAAGKPAEAEAAYRAVITRFPETGALTEAKVRLSELTDGQIQTAQ
jgi:tetratricopeptide (TPR) repeat protein